jgi:hypothetical protein
MAQRVGTHPHVLPRRRDREVANALKLLGRLDAPSLLVDVAEAAASTNPPDPGA